MTDTKPNSPTAPDTGPADAESVDPGTPDRPTKLSVRNLVKDYSTRDGVFRRSTVRAIDDVDLHLYDGEFVCIIGPSGCGKSTLLNIVGGLDRASGGAVEVEGQQVVGPGPDRGMVFQNYSLYPWKSVADNIGFGLELAGDSKQVRARRVKELLGAMELTEFADRLPRELSGGMRQRVAIARALAPEPDLLLLDEPFGALDALTKRSLQDFIRTVWARTGATVLMVTHDVPEAIYLSERIYVMSPRPGRIAEVIDVPFGTSRGPTVKRDPRFLDLVDEIEDMLHSPQPVDDPAGGDRTIEETGDVT